MSRVFSHHIQDACGAIAWSQAWQKSPVVIWRFYQWWIRGGCIQQNLYLGWLSSKIMMSKWLIYPKHSSNPYSLVPDLYVGCISYPFLKKFHERTPKLHLIDSWFQEIPEYRNTHFPRHSLQILQPKRISTTSTNLQLSQVDFPTVSGNSSVEKFQAKADSNGTFLCLSLVPMFCVKAAAKARQWSKLDITAPSNRTSSHTCASKNGPNLVLPAILLNSVSKISLINHLINLQITSSF